MKNAKLLVIPFLLALSTISLISCGKDDGDTPVTENNPPNTTDAETLPYLSNGPKLGTIIGFNAVNPPETESAIEQRWSEAIEAGMSIGRVQVDWPELEPSEGTYDKDALEEKLSPLASQGLSIFLTLPAHDSEEPQIPGDLEGLKFDNQVLIDRFNALMDWVIPMLAANNGWVIAISNEPDNLYGEQDGLASEMLVFLTKVKDHIHSIDSKMAVTITQAEGNLDINRPGLDAIVEASDVASWNFYGSNFDAIDVPQNATQIREELNELMTFSGDKQIIFQELGMHSGSQFLNSSEEIQNTFFETVFTEMQTHDQLRAAYVFQLVDWSPETTAIFVEFFEAEGLPQLFIDQFSESLETIGLINYEDGKKKLAWDSFVESVSMFK